MSHIEHPITVGFVEHQAADCPALFADKAAEVVPALRAAAEAKQLPEAFAFSSKDHKGAFVTDGTTAEVEAALPALPYHEVRLNDASGDETVHVILHNPERLADEAQAREFLGHVGDKFDEGFPNIDQGPVVYGADLADFIESKHT